MRRGGLPLISFCSSSAPPPLFFTLQEDHSRSLAEVKYSSDFHWLPSSTWFASNSFLQSVRVTFPSDFSSSAVLYDDDEDDVEVHLDLEKWATDHHQHRADHPFFRVPPVVIRTIGIQGSAAGWSWSVYTPDVCIRVLEIFRTDSSRSLVTRVENEHQDT